MRTRPLLLLTALALVAPGAVRAQSGGPYDLSWNTFDGGGGSSSAGAYALSGTIAQADAGRLAGGVYALSGGFWVTGVHTLDAPALPDAVPVAFRLYPPFPNPAAGASTIAFDLPAERHVSVRVFDVTGHLVRVLLDGTRPAGRHLVRWDGGDAGQRRVPAGMYFTQVEAGESSATTKIVLLGPDGGAR